MRLLNVVAVIASCALCQGQTPSDVFTPTFLENVSERMVSISIPTPGVELNSTGIRIDSHMVMISEVAWACRKMSAGIVRADGQPVRKAVVGVGGMVMLWAPVPDGDDVPSIGVAPKMPAGVVDVVYAGYREGMLVVRRGMARVDSRGAVAIDSPDVGIGWGIFRIIDGKLIAVVRAYIVSRSSPGIAITVVTEAAAFIFKKPQLSVSPSIIIDH